MKRFAFTIIFNGIHHLKHNDYYKFIVNNFDHWVVAEGAAQSNGSTSWCKTIPDSLHNNGRSVDGTVEFLKVLEQEYPNISLVTTDGFWHSKDAQVNACIEELKKKYNEGYLWEIDSDEQWTLDNIQKAEKTLTELNLKTAAFPAYSWLGPNLQARGVWGECIKDGYTRLWNWAGEYFQKHEPPILAGNNKPMKILPIYFDHYNYYFEKDVKFKDTWYSAHEGILENWKILQKLSKEEFPKPISAFFNSGWIRNTNTEIIYTKD